MSLKTLLLVPLILAFGMILGCKNVYTYCTCKCAEKECCKNTGCCFTSKN